MNIALRPAEESDREFLLRLYEISREFELSMTQWDAAQKRAFAANQFDAQTWHYREKYPHATHNIILYSNEPVGRLYVERGEDQIAILDITIVPEHRKKGICTELVIGIKTEAQSTKRSVRIFIEPFNPAQKLFGELGFKAVPDEGVDLRFEWYPGNVKS